MGELIKELEARMRAIPVAMTGPEGHPDLRVAKLMVEAAEAMREACINTLTR
jgi:hypothetical protein